ncbi:type IV pilin protein [Cytobacillus praedii]|uniref:type IV pilin protein n=1 Tax=Cytobacillus praedii TaxID=1742358 RepID=UPI002E219341|nr:prepilin-type N-terminal cleavage/methylation domain-containing protein [Cytobacillus praedii]
MLKNLKKRLKDQRGLTLVELLAVVVILGIIAAIAVPSIGNIIAKSKYDAAKADAIQVLNSTNLYIASSGVKTATISSTDSEATHKLAEYLEDVTPEGLKSYTVTITNGKATISAISNHPAKKVDAPTFIGGISDINKLTYDNPGTTPDPNPTPGS